MQQRDTTRLETHGPQRREIRAQTRMGPERTGGAPPNSRNCKRAFRAGEARREWQTRPAPALASQVSSPVTDHKAASGGKPRPGDCRRVSACYRVSAVIPQAPRIPAQTELAGLLRGGQLEFAVNLELPSYHAAGKRIGSMMIETFFSSTRVLRSGESNLRGSLSIESALCRVLGRDLCRVGLL